MMEAENMKKEDEIVNQPHVYNSNPRKYDPGSVGRIAKESQ